jgi:hypothetical protein
MTAKQAIEIKQQIEAIYPSMKKDATIDTTWLVALQHETYASAKWACKEMVRTRYQYVPNLTSFLKFCDQAYDRYAADDIESGIIRSAIENGYLDNYNREDRLRTIQKIIGWEESGLINKIDWFIKAMAKYKPTRPVNIPERIGGLISHESI